MGGNALSQPSVRLNRGEYSRLVEEVSDRIMQTLMTRFEVIPAYELKPSFGDMDILIYPGFDQGDIARALGATEFKRNGDVTSYGVETSGGLFQIDLIRAAPEQFDFSLGYFSFNDLGNLAGRIAHKAGFKLGHRGLIYVLRDQTNSDQVIDEIMVSMDWKAALGFFGFDANRYDHGFAFLDDVFKFVAASPYFNKEIYQFDNMNHISRTRDRKRPTYNQFLQWIEEKPDLPQFDWSDKESIRSEFLERALTHFDGFKERMNDSMAKHKRTIMVKSKFNGGLFAELSGLEGRELGRAIKGFRDSFGSDALLNEWVIGANPSEINQKILDFCQTDPGQQAGEKEGHLSLG